MSRIKQFFISTQKFSRVLVVLWFFFSLAGAGFDASEFIYTFPIMAVFFLLPAILIERKKNPVWVKAINESKIKKLEAEAIANQQRKEEAIRLQQLKEENERLKQESDSEVEKVEQDTTNHLTFKRNDGGAVDSPQELPFVTRPSEEASPAIKEDPPSKNTKEKAPLSHSIGGVILIVLSSFLCLLIIPVFVLGEKKLIFPAMFGFGGLMFGISLCCGKFMKFEQSKKSKGVYLTQDQIERLEQKIELPILDTPVFLDYGEVAVYHSQATRQEIKNRVIGRTGSYSGGTIRIAKGLSIHTGGSSSRPIYGDVSMQYTGEFIITNERIIFLSNQKGFELNHQNITAATAYKDGFAFQSKNTSYVLLVPRMDLATIAFDGVRTGAIPIGNICVSDDCDCDYDYDYDENIDPTDVSSIDGMDGYEFEYFCADILEKNGFINVSVTRGSGDQGVDVLATKAGIKYAIQCKNYESSLGNTPIQEVNAGKIFYKCHVGVVMTNSRFTPGARALAEATGTLLWDRTELQNMMKVLKK